MKTAKIKQLFRMAFTLYMFSAYALGSEIPLEVFQHSSSTVDTGPNPLEAVVTISKEQYVSKNGVMAQATITNVSSRDIDIVSDPATCWMAIIDGHGQLINSTPRPTAIWALDSMAYKTPADYPKTRFKAATRKEFTINISHVLEVNLNRDNKKGNSEQERNIIPLKAGHYNVRLFCMFNWYSDSVNFVRLRSQSVEVQYLPLIKAK
ncbi:MAG: hypothetical protein ACI8WB_005199 [Phenylobacterium sp.]|jgi:hypothetical protein